jgi:hypothetical protein
MFYQVSLMSERLELTIGDTLNSTRIVVDRDKEEEKSKEERKRRRKR